MFRSIDVFRPSEETHVVVSGYVEFGPNSQKSATHFTSSEMLSTIVDIPVQTVLRYKIIIIL